MEMKHTPRLNLKSHQGLGNGLGLGLLLLAVLSKASLTLGNNLRVLLFLVTAEEVHVVVVLSRLVLGVGGQLGALRAIGSVGLGGITREAGELRLERSNMLVPASNVRVLLSVRGAREGLEGHNIGLGRSIAILTG